MNYTKNITEKYPAKLDIPMSKVKITSDLEGIWYIDRRWLYGLYPLKVKVMIIRAFLCDVRSKELTKSSQLGFMC